MGLVALLFCLQIEKECYILVSTSWSLGFNMMGMWVYLYMIVGRLPYGYSSALLMSNTCAEFFSSSF